MTRSTIVLGLAAFMAACGGGNNQEAKDPTSGAAAGAAGGSSPTSTTSTAVSTGSSAGLKPFQKEALEKFDGDIKGSLDAVNKACGTSIKVSSDFSNYKEEAWSGNSVSSRCSSVLDGIAAVCAKSHYKPEVAKNVAEVKCIFGGTGTDAKANMSHSGKVFTTKMNVEASNLQDAATTVLQNKLDGK